MKLVTFIKDDAARLGAIRTRNGRQVVVDLNGVEPRLPADAVAFLQAGEPARRLAEETVANARRDTDLSAVALTAPVPRPGKIICIGLNYRDHAQESNQPIPDYPTIFGKYANSVVGSGQPIVLPQDAHKVDYEGEMGVVIGRRGRHVAEEHALEYVAGYLPCNDVSARDFQYRTTQWTIGKICDGFAPMGPALVTADEIPDPHNLDIQLTVNGEVMQSSNTRHLIFTVPRLIAYITQLLTLEPGDMILTGTPGGVGHHRKPPLYLKPGDEVRVEIERLGALVNPVVAEC